MLNSATLTAILVNILAALFLLVSQSALLHILPRKLMKQIKTYKQQMLRNNSCYFYNYKLYCVIHCNSCCICCRLDWLLPHLNPKIFLFIFNIGGRHNWISCCQSNSIQENFLFKKERAKQAAILRQYVLHTILLPPTYR